MAGAGFVDTLVAANWDAAICKLKKCSLVGYDNSHALKVCFLHLQNDSLVYEQSGLLRTWDNFSWTLSMTDLFADYLWSISLTLIGQRGARLRIDAQLKTSLPNGLNI